MINYLDLNSSRVKRAKESKTATATVTYKMNSQVVLLSSKVIEYKMVSPCPFLPNHMEALSLPLKPIGLYPSEDSVQLPYMHCYLENAITCSLHGYLEHMFLRYAVILIAS